MKTLIHLGLSIKSLLLNPVEIHQKVINKLEIYLTWIKFLLIWEDQWNNFINKIVALCHFLKFISIMYMSMLFQFD
jgi:hypothetical protein